MKTLMQTFAEEDKGVIFYETVVSHKRQKHTFIEAVPLPWDVFDAIPAVFRVRRSIPWQVFTHLTLFLQEGILASESEWTQHQKLIDFSKRPGGFRRSMVPNLPYFAVQWDYKGEHYLFFFSFSLCLVLTDLHWREGEKGYGHVIEGHDGVQGGGDGYDIDEGEKGGGEFSR
jgi:hypothetical protein